MKKQITLWFLMLFLILAVGGMMYNIDTYKRIIKLKKEACSNFCGELQSFVYEQKCICRSDDGYFGTDL